jgi:phage replication initiation protein
MESPFSLDSFPSLKTDALGASAGMAAPAAAPATAQGIKTIAEIELAGTIEDASPRLVIRGENHSTTPNPRAAFIDWLNFSFPWHKSNGNKFRALDEEFRLAFGFGIRANRFRKHLNYEDSWELGDNLGIFATGGDTVRGTSFVMLTGRGCSAVRSWGDVFLLLGKLKARVTRVDLAHDDFVGQHDVELALRFHINGDFTGQRGRPPGIRLIDDMDTGTGKTLYIGSRKSGKLLRVYEKGRQLGDPNSDWVRWELELHNVDREIPHRIVLEPGKFLAGSYPCMDWVASEQSRVATIRKTAEIGYEALVGHCRKSYGKLIWVMRHGFDMTPEAIVDQLAVEGFPSRLDMAEVGELGS